MPGVGTAIIPMILAYCLVLMASEAEWRPMTDFIKMRNRQKINIILYSLLKLAYQSETEWVTKEIGCSKVWFDGKKITWNFQGMRSYSDWSVT